MQNINISPLIKWTSSAVTVTNSNSDNNTNNEYDKIQVLETSRHSLHNTTYAQWYSIWRLRMQQTHLQPYIHTPAINEIHAQWGREQAHFKHPTPTEAIKWTDELSWELASATFNYLNWMWTAKTCVHERRAAVDRMMNAVNDKHNN